ncbi:Putative Afp-like protein [Cardinium endosymbiont of Sogatella furcifera]|uniref:hypothetical protein n=1 Tax=Cardinium endosymbiont of Sogatella furcifera TaxID=650378 RepID=UPI000E0D4ACD|nr:hypothetical protein [Cardinium endosymbiont of Sogatella furcifera]AXI24302.1 Putative Afp-like protein [Cardinium endosymbiont of Sogatella furcifera]
MQRVTIDYKHFNKAGFDGKTCSVLGMGIPNQKISTSAIVYDTAASAPLHYNQRSAPKIVTFTVDFLPYITSKHLLSKADSLVKEVFESKYNPEPLTYCIHKKDGAIDTKKTVNDVIIQNVKLFLDRKNEATGEKGYVRIRFTLQGLV